MSSLPVLKSRFLIRVSVGAIAFLAISVANGGAIASASSSWNSQPDWESSDTPTNRIRSASRQEQRFNKDADDPSPFAPGSNNLSLEMGQDFLLGSLGASYADSIGMGLHYNYGVSDLFAFDSAFGYSSHSDGQFSMVSLQAGLRTNLAWYDKIVPYGTFGLGFYKPSYTFGNTLAPGQVTAESTSISPILFGVHLGGGVDLELTRKLFFGASLTFNDAFGSSQITSDGKTVDVGGTYTDFFLHAGVTF